ncbi:MAG: MBL fold metallo-hydrolase [Planctomycetia bacterium]|nr:MBL fold metallo-hydrolase [Planctomycetia bacterium]
MNDQPAHGTAGPRVTFWGGAGEVTGTMHLIAAGARRILLDCGLHMERGGDSRKRNREFPFDPATLDAVVLSHAHVDHSGNLPNLVRQGYRGPIYCTAATRDLIDLMLLDSARIQAEEARLIALSRGPGDPGAEALYTAVDVQETLDQCICLPYGQPTDLAPDVGLELVDAGHVLGSAIVALTLGVGTGVKRITFTGDLGRPGMPLLRDPAPLPDCDLLISECTYGGQRHEPIDRMAEMLRVLVKQTIERGGKVLIPAFSLGRTQTVVHCLQQLRLAGQLPDVPIFVDSPLAGDISQIYPRHPECMSADGVRDLQGAVNFLQGPLLHYVKSVEESKALNMRREPCILVASSGMGEGGRIRHHLKHNIDDPRCTVILISYQPRDTLGWRLLERRPTVRIMGREQNKWADVVSLRGFSGHADHADLLQAISPFAGRPVKVCLVHGEFEPARQLAADLTRHGLHDVSIPERGQTVNVV